MGNFGVVPLLHSASDMYSLSLSLSLSLSVQKQHHTAMSLLCYTIAAVRTAWAGTHAHTHTTVSMHDPQGARATKARDQGGYLLCSIHILIVHCMTFGSYIETAVCTAQEGYAASNVQHTRLIAVAGMYVCNLGLWTFRDFNL